MVADESWASVAFGLDSSGRQLESFQVPHELVGGCGPEAVFDEGREFVSQEFSVFGVTGGTPAGSVGL